MRISHLTLHNFRNFEELSFHPDVGLNILVGKNAQGKTSLIESIYMLASGRSWRANRDMELVRWGTEDGRISGDVEREDQNNLEVEITLSRTEKKQIKINTIRQTKLADFLGHVNVVLIEPHDVDIVRGDPGTRRKFLNLEISQIQPQYCHLLVSYRKVIEQRNHFLKGLERRHAGDGLLDVLNEQLIEYGSKIMERRLAFISHIAELARALQSQISEGNEVLGINYSTSVRLEGTENKAERIAERLRFRLEELRNIEIHRGVTLVGPQRDDLIFTINDVDARTYASQGQQRTIALSLRLAELQVMEETAGEQPIVLLDDVMTDLDESRRERIFEMTRGRCQTFVTAGNRRALEPEFLRAAKVFLVDQGRVTEE